MADVATAGIVLWGILELPGPFGALPVLAFGLTLANGRALRAKRGAAGAGEDTAISATVSRLHDFIAHLTFVVRAYFFVFLGVVVSFFHLPWKGYVLAAAAVLAMLAARHATLSFATDKGLIGLDREERRAVLLLQPRGLVSAVLALKAGQRGFDGAGLLLGLASLAIILTNLLLIVAARASAAANAGGQRPAVRLKDRGSPPA